MAIGKGQRQLAVRLEDEVLLAIDRKRMEIAERTGEIPTRSDIVRDALAAYLDADRASAKDDSAE